jgi:myo-inositol-1(or 4)-monophosphatase
MLGSAAIDLAWLAHGRTDAAVIFGGKPWDTAAGVVLVREANGLVVDVNGEHHSLWGASTVASSGELLNGLLHLISPST